METNKHFKEFLECLNARCVEYILVGGYAVAFHGAPRFTGDIDVFARPTRENGRLVMAAMKDFGYLPPNVSEDDFIQPGMIIQIGLPPYRVDVITGIEGVSWEEASASRVPGLYGEVEVPYIGIEALVKNKKAVGRPKDLMDLDNLGKLGKKKK